MCWTCVLSEVREVGTVTIEGDHVALGPLIRKLYATEWGSVGGPLHIVLDDSNVQDHNLDFCQAEVEGREHWTDPAMNDADRALCLDIIDRLRFLPTDADRAVAIQEAHDGNPSPPGVMYMVDARWPDNLVLAQRWPR